MKPKGATTMCGIIGYVGVSPCANILLKGLQKLEYRGYDSAGIAVLEQVKIEAFKEKGRLENLRYAIQGGKNLSAATGIGHTRWATHGIPSVANSHPHLSNNRKFAVVHNGIIENYAALRSDLIAKGYRFFSQTDTEVISVLLEENDCGDMLNTIQKTAGMLEGSYALGILCCDTPDTLYCVRHSSPLIVGLGQDQCFIASDVTPLLNYTRRVYQLSDGEIAVLNAEGAAVFDAALNPVDKEIVEISWNVETAEKDGYDHFMLKEIFEQPRAVRATLEPRIKAGKIVLPELNLSLEQMQAITKIC
ncbi:MAG: glutamine--fructose-6-phosphate aminotransferase, partial [Clostridiales bacterium]|nr:glutamine--fructose-6-phosphate aminotransferase [Clostridiales bacterium]